MKRRSFLLTSLVAVLLSCKHEEAWQRLDSPEGRFVVDMPVRPRTGSQKANTGWGQLEVRFYEAETQDGAVVYSVTYTDYPLEGVDATKAESLLLEAQSAAVKDVSGVVLSESADTCQGHPARRSGIRAASGVEYQLLVVLARARLYQVSTASRPGKLSAEDGKRFFASFRIRD